MANLDKIQELQEILQNDAENFQVRRELAVILLDNGFTKEALQHFIWLTKYFQDDAKLFYNIGITYEK